MRPETALRCSHCQRIAPREITDRISRLVILEGGPGHVVEVRGWALRLGGGSTGATVVSCPDHYTETGITPTV